MKFYLTTKLDRRHTGYNQFAYYIDPIYNSRLDDKLRFLGWRKWCWETFGPGMERNWAIKLGSAHYPVTKWAWHTPHDQLPRIYFMSERELNWFHLTWSTNNEQ